jgi:hypothetical protein
MQCRRAVVPSCRRVFVSSCLRSKFSLIKKVEIKHFYILA